MNKTGFKQNKVVLDQDQGGACKTKLRYLSGVTLEMQVSKIYAFGPCWTSACSRDAAV